MNKKHTNITPLLLMGGMASLLLTACQTQEETVSSSSSIQVNTIAISGSTRSADLTDNTFTVLFWRQPEKLENPTKGTVADWNTPYIASTAPQPVSFYPQIVYDTMQPYPSSSGGNSWLYATGYAPGKVLEKDATLGYKKLTASFTDHLEKGRYDFLSCDVWRDVYKGSQADPFSQEKNRLYFRHLSSKLTFYADRDELMENKQYVRNAQVTNLQMSIDGGKNWTPMYTPSAFEWQTLKDDDYTAAYNKVIDEVKKIDGNTTVTSKPVAGYKATDAETFAGANNTDYVLKGSAVDLIPLKKNGSTTIDSCFVCNPMDVDGKIQIGQQIQLKMDISAELSPSQDFPKPDSESSTDDITYTKTWTNYTVPIFGVDKDGNVNDKEIITEFKPGKEYRIYLHFFRSGVYLVAKELPWYMGGEHYVVIQGGDNQGTGNNN